MIIKCECGKLVCEGELRHRKNGSKALDIIRKEKGGIMIKGTIIKNHSHDPRKWKGICSDCQKKK